MRPTTIQLYKKSDNKRIWFLYNELLVRLLKYILDLKDIGNFTQDIMKQNMRGNLCKCRIRSLRPCQNRIGVPRLIQITGIIHKGILGDFRNTENLIHINIPRDQKDQIVRDHEAFHRCCNRLNGLQRGMEVYFSGLKRVNGGS